MSTYVQLLYHIVFSTKNRELCLHRQARPELFRYISGVLKNAKCHVYQINGIEDHLHILTSLHPTVSIATLVKDIKISTHNWIKSKDIFPQFQAWQEGYSAFTCAYRDIDPLMKYILNQDDHHHNLSFKEELRRLVAEAQVPINERFFPE